MLQQILRDMYIAPELLAELDETQKQTLFCRMREEQVRRWRIWDQQETEILKKMSSSSTHKMSNGKKVHFLLDNEDEPLVIVINQYQYINGTNDDHDGNSSDKDDTSNWSEKSCKQIDNNCVIMTENSVQNNNNRIPMEQDCIDFKEKEESTYKTRNGIECKNTSYMKQSPVNIKFSEKRALQELSLNKVQNVAKRVAEWEQRVNESSTMSPVDNKVKNKKNESSPEVNEIEEKEEQIWREQQKKAKEVETRIRSIARRAREEHRRSLLEVNDDNISESSYSKFLHPDNTVLRTNGVVISAASTTATTADIDTRKPPASKREVINWFKSKEVPRNAGYCTENNSVASWFHGLISNQEAEMLLSKETIGSFLVRISEKIWGYAVSYKDVSCYKHFLIDASNGYYRFLGIDATKHKSLNDLVDYHTRRPITVTGGETLRHICMGKNDISDLFRN